MKLKKNLVFIGMPGCGKTTISNEVAKRLEAELYDVDEFIVKTEGKSIDELFKNGEDYFRSVEKKAIDVISAKSGVIISTGGGVIKIPDNITTLKRNGTIIFIDRTVENIEKTMDYNSRPLLKDNHERLKQLYKERILLYKKYCDYEVKNNRGLNLVVDEIVKIVKLKERS